VQVYGGGDERSCKAATSPAAYSTTTEYSFNFSLNQQHVCLNIG
jgi:hypothetical protein